MSSRMPSPINHNNALSGMTEQMQDISAYPQPISDSIVSMADNGPRLHDYLSVLWRRGWVFLGCFILVLGSTILFTSMMKNRYEATALLQENTPADNEKNPLMLNQSNLATDIALVTGNTTLEHAVQTLSTTSAARHYSASQLRRALKVDTVGDTNLIGVTAISTDPREAMTLANAVALAFKDIDRERQQSNNRSAAQYLAPQLNEAKRQLSNTEVALTSFRRQHPEVQLPAEGQNVDIQRAANFQTTLAQERIQLAGYRKTIETLRQQINTMNRSLMSSTQIRQHLRAQELQTRLSEVEDKLFSQQQMYTDEHASVQNLKAERDHLQQQLQAAIRENVARPLTSLDAKDATLSKMLETETVAAASDARVKTIQTQLKASTERLATLPAQQGELVRLMRDADVAETIYKDLLQRVREVQVKLLTDVGRIAVVEEATVSKVPVSPNRPLNILYGIICGLLLGVLSALIVEYFDDTLKQSEDIERLINLPVLGSIGQSAEESRKVLANITSEHFFGVYARIRSALSFTSLNDSAPTYIISSNSSAEGKTHTACHLALSYAQTKKRVLLVDADLRRPCVHLMFGLPNTVGVTSVLTGETTLANAVRCIEGTTLQVLPCGQIPPNPVGILESEAFAQLYRQFHDIADIVIIDSPPIAMVPDALILARLRGSLVLVTESGRTHRRDLLALIRACRQVGARIAGLILNKVPVSLNRHGYNYGYNYYAYGESPTRTPLMTKLMKPLLRYFKPNRSTTKTSITITKSVVPSASDHVSDEKDRR